MLKTSEALGFLPPEPLPSLYLNQTFRVESVDPAAHQSMKITAPDGRTFFVHPSDFEPEGVVHPERELLDLAALVVRKWTNHDLVGFDLIVRSLQQAHDAYLFFKIHSREENDGSLNGSVLRADTRVQKQADQEGRQRKIQRTLKRSTHAACNQDGPDFVGDLTSAQGRL